MLGGCVCMRCERLLNEREREASEQASELLRNLSKQVQNKNRTNEPTMQ